MPEGVKTSFRQLSGINAVGAVGGTLRSCLRYISLIVSSASLSGCAAGVATKCNADNIRGAYFRSVLYFSVIRWRGSKLSLRDRNCVSSRLLTNSCQGITSSIAAQGSSPDFLACSSAWPTVTYCFNLLWISLPVNWSLSACLRFAWLNRPPIMRSCSSITSSVNVALASWMTQTSVA